MMHSRVVAALAFTLMVTSVAAAERRVATAGPASIAPYADYITYVTTFHARTTGDRALAIATTDPDATRCFAGARTRVERETCQRFLQEKALVEAMPTIALAARTKHYLDANPDDPSRHDMLPIGQACVASVDRLGETGIAPLRKIGPYTIGLLKSKLCNALLVSAAER